MKLPVIVSAACMLAEFNAAAGEFAHLRQTLSARMPDLANGEIGLADKLAAKFHIAGIQGLVFENNRLVPGVLPREQIEAILAGLNS
ncbi:MAG: hypothetical protein ACKVP2_09470 [Burkholderiales bacterium]